MFRFNIRVIFFLLDKKASAHTLAFRSHTPIDSLQGMDMLFCNDTTLG